MGKISDEQSEYYGLLHIEGAIKEKLVRWVSQNFNRNELDKYAHKFNKKNFGELESTEEIATFFDWFFLEAVHKEEGKKMLEIITDNFSNLFDSDELKIIKEWLNNTQAGIFEIEETNKKYWKVALQEIFTNKKYEIMDRRASEYAIKGDIIFGRVQKIFSNYYLSGAVTAYPRFLLLDKLKKFVNQRYTLEKQKTPSMSYERFMNVNSRILNDFAPEEPKYKTAEGEEQKICEATYFINSEHIKVILDWFDQDEGFLITDVDYKGNKVKSANIACRAQKKQKERDDKHEGFMLMCHYIDGYGNKTETEGSIEIKNDKLNVHSMSKRAFKRILSKIGRNLGKYLELKNEEIKTVDDVLKEVKEKGDKLQKKRKNDANLITLEMPIMEQYYKEWCDQKIPALNNKTPRKAIETEEGRELIKKLLIDFENHEQHKKRDGEQYIPVEKIIRKELNFYE